MSQENVDVARRTVAFFVGLGGQFEADQAAHRMPDSALSFRDGRVLLLQAFSSPDGALEAAGLR